MPGYHKQDHHMDHNKSKNGICKNILKYDFDTQMNEWIGLAKSDRWAKCVECKLALVPDTYKGYKFRR